MPKIKEMDFRVFIALITVQILFGINYVVSKFIVGTFSPIVWANFRVIVSAIVLFGISLKFGKKSPVLDRKFFVHMMFYALLGVAINQTSFLVGLKYTTATNSAVLNTLIPIFTLLLVTLTGREPLTLRRGFGFCLALLGVLVIRKIEDFSLSNQTLIGDSLTVLNCLSYACFLTVGKKFLEKYDSLWATTWLFILGSFALTLFALPSWLDFQLPEFNLKILSCMAFSIFGSTLLAYLLNVWALARVQSSSVALYIYLQPVIASLLAWTVFHEQITLRTVLASLLIFAGMIFTQTKGAGRSKENKAT
jgi:drug/metabolite transporter (DMT)-like permease